MNPIVFLEISLETFWRIGQKSSYQPTGVNLLDLPPKSVGPITTKPSIAYNYMFFIFLIQMLRDEIITHHSGLMVECLFEGWSLIRGRAPIWKSCLYSRHLLEGLINQNIMVITMTLHFIHSPWTILKKNYALSWIKWT